MRAADILSRIVFRRSLFFTLLFTLSVRAHAAQAPRTMRVDYFHTGTATEEQFALDSIELEGAWPLSLIHI